MLSVLSSDKMDGDRTGRFPLTCSNLSKLQHQKQVSKALNLELLTGPMQTNFGGSIASRLATLPNIASGVFVLPMV